MRVLSCCFAFAMGIVCAAATGQAAQFSMGSGTLNVFAQASSPGNTQTDDPPPITTGPALGVYTHTAHATSASAVADIVLNAELAPTALTLSGSGLAARGLTTNFADARGGWGQVFSLAESAPVRVTIATDAAFMNGSVAIFNNVTNTSVFARSWIPGTHDLTLAPGEYRFEAGAQIPQITGPRTNLSASLSIVPEPMSGALLCAAFAGGAIRVRRRRRR